ncbi:response regulator transcription factor [Dyella humicola]|uniref:response regulator transcription factor n=1 Tax=Dyella humicola TaxID=2992126 RepID=UPI0022516FDC|nr:response regulator transcription factor [Dyella humicola]
MSGPKQHDKPAAPAALRVAIVEDEERFREAVLVPALCDFGFDAMGVGSAGALYKSMLSHQFDIIVLDIGLPDDSGLNIVRHLRQLNAKIGLIMLTASVARQDQIQALSEGADMYLPKPIDVDVLALTLRSLARRLSAANEAAPPASSDWRLDPTGWCLLAPNGTIFALTSSERSIVNALIDADGSPVTREALIEALGEDPLVFDHHRLDMLVYRLRRKLSDSDCGQNPLLTSRGAGYLFVKRP